MKRTKKWTALAMSAMLLAACSSLRDDDDNTGGRVRPVSVGAVQVAPEAATTPVGAAHYANDRAQFVGNAQPAGSVVATGTSAGSAPAQGGISAPVQTGAATVTGATRGTTGLVPGVANAANPNSVSDQAITPTAVAGKSEVSSTAAATPVPPMDRPAAGTAPSVPNSTLASDYTAAAAERQVTPTIAAGANPITSTANVSTPTAALDRSAGTADGTAILSDAKPSGTGTTAVASNATATVAAAPAPAPAKDVTPAVAPAATKTTSTSSSGTKATKASTKKSSKKKG